MTIDEAKQKVLNAFEMARWDEYKMLADAYSTLTNAQHTKIHQIDGFKKSEKDESSG
jgi:hypothetical protein